MYSVKAGLSPKENTEEVKTEEAEIDIEHKLIVKSATPINLRILADRYVQTQRGAVDSKILVISPGKEWCSSI